MFVINQRVDSDYGLEVVEDSKKSKGKQPKQSGLSKGKEAKTKSTAKNDAKTKAPKKKVWDLIFPELMKVISCYAVLCFGS